MLRMGSSCCPWGLQAGQEWSREGAVCAAPPVSLGVLPRTTHLLLKYYREYFRKLFTFFFFLRVTAEWKSLSPFNSRLYLFFPHPPNPPGFLVFHFSRTTGEGGSCTTCQRVLSQGQGAARPPPCWLYAGDAPFAATPGANKCCVRSIAPAPLPPPWSG